MVIPTGVAFGPKSTASTRRSRMATIFFTLIKRASLAHGATFFPPRQVAFTRRFGEIAYNLFGDRWDVEGDPEIVVVCRSHQEREGRPASGAAKTGTTTWATPFGRRAGQCLTPKRFPTLHGLPLGDTEFAATGLYAVLAARWATSDLVGRKRRPGLRSITTHQ